MKIKYVLLFVLIIIIICFIISMRNKKTKKKIKTHKFFGKIARSEDEIIKGLMFRKHKLNSDEGMLFVMNYGINTMWMKNTYIPLDMIFLNSRMKVVGYIENTEPLSLKQLYINHKSKYVLEMNAGSVKLHNIKKRDKINFSET